MTSPLPKYTGRDTAAQLVRELGTDYAVVENPQYIFPPYDLYPFAPPRTELDEGLRGAVMDMDGTTTTTEPLCIHSLDWMVRRITNRPGTDDWSGLDHDRDYPHIIGNSTTKHVEYLVRTYREAIDPEALRRAYIQAAAWTLGRGADEGRRREVAANLNALGLGSLAAAHEFHALSKEGGKDKTLLDELAARFEGNFKLDALPDIVRAAVDIYYHRYHEILGLIDAGKGDSIAREVFGHAGEHLIEPMPGIGIYLALIKGWLGADASGCAAPLLAHLEENGFIDGVDKAHASTLLARLGQYFEAQPARVAIVTSSIEYEARIVLKEVFRVLQSQVAAWDIPQEKRAFIQQQFDHPLGFYDGFITASDSSEIRLKPHRDLYSLALHRLGILPEDFHKVAGFEDSESGTIAIRAAGIPLCCALPFTMTRGHTFHAATQTCPGGLPQVLLRHRAFLAESLLRD